MRIAVVNQFSSAGGGARFVRALVSALASTYDTVEIGLFQDATNLRRDSLPELFADRGQVKVIPLMNGLPITSVERRTGDRVNQAYMAVRRTLKKITPLTSLYYGAKARAERRTPGWADFQLDDETVRRLETYDIVYLAWPYFIEPVAFHVPLVATLHDFNFKYPFGNFTPKMLDAVERQVPGWLAEAASIVVSSEFMREEMEKFYPSKARRVDVVRLTTFSITTSSTSDFEALRRRLDLPREYVLCASNTAHHKNLLMLLKAAGELKKRNSLIPIAFAGHGTENLGRFAHSRFPQNHPMFAYQVMAEAILEAGLRPGHDIFPLGYVSDKEIDALIRHARLLVSPSLYEAGSGPAVDAWASGTPVAFSDIPPFLEQIEHLGTEAWTFDPLSPSSMADAIESATSQPKVSAAMAARSKTAIERRTWAQIAEDYMRIFERAAARAPSRENRAAP